MFVVRELLGDRPWPVCAGVGFDPKIGVSDAPMRETKGPRILCVPIETQRDEGPNMIRTPLEAQSAPYVELLCRSGAGMWLRRRQRKASTASMCVQARGRGGAYLSCQLGDNGSVPRLDNVACRFIGDG